MVIYAANGSMTAENTVIVPENTINSSNKEHILIQGLKGLEVPMV